MANIILPGEERELNRRSFLKVAGFGAAALATMSVTGCEDDDDVGVTPNTGVNLGSGDTGILNYAYALEQLEAEFYVQAVAGGAFTGDELNILKDVRDHEIAHREFFKAALKADAIPMLTPAQFDFSKINFANRANVLATARTFEQLGVSAYNGAGRYLTSEANLVFAGKIVSVEARHLAAIEDLISARSEKTVRSDVDNNGLDQIRRPAQVLPLVQPYLKVTLNASNLPK